MRSTVALAFHSFTLNGTLDNEEFGTHTHQKRNHSLTCTDVSGRDIAYCLLRLDISLYFGPKSWNVGLNVHGVHQRHTAVTKAPSPCLYSNRREGIHVGLPSVVIMPLAGSWSDRLE